jgi:hypothetical protein
VDGREIRPLGGENDKAFALVNALDLAQRKQAILSDQLQNLVLGPGTDGKMIAPEGARASTFTAAQRTMLTDLVREWVAILGDEAAAAKMKDVQAGIADTYFAWARPIENGKGPISGSRDRPCSSSTRRRATARTTSITSTPCTAIRRTVTRPGQQRDEPGPQKAQSKDSRRGVGDRAALAGGRVGASARRVSPGGARVARAGAPEG